MNTEDQEMLEKLRRLRSQVDTAILMVNAGMVSFDVNFFDRTSPDTFEVGDFIVKNRFVEPRGEK